MHYVSRRCKDWKLENKRLFKGGFKTILEVKQFMNSFRLKNKSWYISIENVIRI